MRPRHPYRSIEQRVADAFRWMLDHHYWRKHPEPFNKSWRGRLRRQERKFVLAQQEGAIQ